MADRPMDYRVTIYQTEEDEHDGTYTVLLEERLTRSHSGTWKSLGWRTVPDHAAAWAWAADQLQAHDVKLT